MGGKCGKVCGAAVGVALLAVAIPVVRQYASLHAEQKFAFMTTHNATALPSNHASRYRGREYFRDDRFFFQWWNYIVFDAETRDHFNLIYQITEFSAKFAGGRNLSQAHTSMGHFKGSSFRSAGGEAVPLADCSLQGDWGVHLHKDGGKGRRPFAAADEFTNKALRDATAKPLARDVAEAVLQGIPYQQNVLDDDTYHLLATVPADKSLTGVPLSWDLTFKRVHGVYTNADAEEGSRGDMCMMLSTLWGYHSEVWGTITEGDKTYKITRSPRYRAYAAGSWGCTLPTGKPAVQYPWVWFWLIVPGAVPAQDLSFAWGGATMQSPGNAVGDIDGYFTVTGIDGHVLSSRKAQIFHNTAIQLPLQSSTSDSYITELYSTRGDWQLFRDRHGQALIPLSQTFYMKTKTYNITVDFTSRAEQYFRAPVWIEDFVDHSMHMFSDFRAVGVRAHITIQKRDAATGVWKPHTDLVTESMNALEYAYDADVAVDPLTAWKERFTTLPGAKEIVDKAIRDDTKADVAL